MASPTNFGYYRGVTDGKTYGRVSGFLQRGIEGEFFGVRPLPVWKHSLMQRLHLPSQCL